MPLAAVSSEPRSLQGQDHSNLAPADRGQQAVVAGTMGTVPGRRRPPRPPASPAPGRDPQARTGGHGSRDCIGPGRGVDWRTRPSLARKVAVRVMVGPRARARHHLQYQRADQANQIPFCSVDIGIAGPSGANRSSWSLFAVASSASPPRRSSCIDRRATPTKKAAACGLVIHSGRQARVPSS